MSKSTAELSVERVKRACRAVIDDIDDIRAKDLEAEIQHQMSIVRRRWCRCRYRMDREEALDYIKRDHEWFSTYTRLTTSYHNQRESCQKILALAEATLVGTMSITVNDFDQFQYMWDKAND